MLLASLLHARGAEAASLSDTLQDGAAAAQADLPEWLANVDPDAIATLTLEQLKELFDAEALAQLGLDPLSFAELVDGDLEEAIRQLENAFRKKLKLAAAAGETKIADGDIRASATDADSSDGHHSALGESSALLWVLGGVVAAGGLGLALSGGGSDRDDSPPPPPNTAPVAVNDTVSTREDSPVTFDVRTNDRDADGDALTVTQINGVAITTTSPVAISGGSISLGTDGRLTFTPSANFNGTPSFTYAISDGKGGAATGSVNLTVEPVNDAPVVGNDTFTTNEDSPVTINVLANDTDVEGSALAITHVDGKQISVEAPVAVAGGVVSLVGGNLVFTPELNFNGAPSFTYTVSDGAGGSATATVSGTVVPVNDAPTNTAPDAVAGAQGSAIQIGGLAVSDPDLGDILTTTLSVGAGALFAVDGPNGATISGSGTSTLTLTGSVAQINATLSQISFNGGASFFGTTALTITTTDGEASDTDVVDLTVARVINGIVEDGYVAGATVFIDIDGNGELDDGEPSTVTDENGHFVLTGNASGMIVAIGGVNIDTGLPNEIPLKAPLGATVVSPITTLVAELVERGESIQSAKAAVAEALGIPPSVDLDSYDFLAPSEDPEMAELAVAVQKSATQIVTVLATAQAAAADGEAKAVQSAVLANIVNAAASGARLDLSNIDTVASVLNNVAGIPAGTAQQVTVQVTAINQSIASATSAAEIANTVVALNGDDVDLPPITVTDEVTIAEDGGSVSFNVLANDFDAEGGAITLRTVNGVAATPGASIEVVGGTILVGTAGQLRFTPASDFNGQPSFKYTIADAGGNVQTGTVRLDVTPVNDAPVASADSVSTTQNSAITFDPRANDSDIDGDSLTITRINGSAISVTNPVSISGGVVSLGADGRLTFTPTSNFVGTPAFEYTISDGKGGTATSRVEINVLEPDNQAPTAVADRIDAVEDQPVIFDVRLNDIDPNGDPLSVTHINGAQISVQNPVIAAEGSFRINAEGAISFSPNANFNGTVNFTYRVVDGRGGSSNGSGEIAVAPVNDAPVAVNDSFTMSEDGDAIVIDVLANDSDIDGDALTITQVNGTAITADAPVSVTGGLVSLLDGKLVFKPAANFNGTPSFTYTVSDGQGGTSVGTVNGTVTPVNDAPIAVNDNFTTGYGTPVTINVRANDTDVEGDLLTVTHVNGTAITTANPVSVEGGTVSLVGGNLVFTPSAAFVGAPTFTYAVSDGKGGVATGTVNGSVTVGETLNVTPESFAAVVGNIQAFADAGVQRLDIVSAAGVTITDGQARLLLNAGVEFVEADTIVINASGTQLDTSLKGLQQLNVDSVVARGVLSLDAGGDLGGLSAGGLPQFDIYQTDADLDVTLNVASGSFGGIGNFNAIASALAGAGIDHIGVSGSGALSLTQAQAQTLNNVGLDFVDAAVISVETTAAGAGTINAGTLAAIKADFVDVTGDGVATISDAQASALLNAGVAFVESDMITVEASGTHLNTSLKGLQKLHVDSVSVAAGTLVVQAGGSLGELSVTGLPRFDLAQTDEALDLTLNVEWSELPTSLDLGNLAQSLAAAGVDHIGVVGSRPLSLTLAQAQAIAGAGLDFAPASNVVVSVVPEAVANLDIGLLASLNIDQVDVAGSGIATISDAQASAMLDAGLSFVESDMITLEASGTNLDTSLKGLQKLHVDSVSVATGALGLDAGGMLTDVSVSGLPTFNVALGSPALDVTLNVSAGSIANSGSIDTIANALAQAGVDHIGVNGAGNITVSYAQGMSLDAAGLNFVQAANVTLLTSADLFNALDVAQLSRLNVDHMDVVGDTVTIRETTAAQLLAAGLDFVESDMVTVEAAGTHLGTTLKGLQQLHVDSVAARGVLSLGVGDGGIAGLSASGLPQFDIAQDDSALDLTLNIGAADLADLNAGTLGALRAAGVDHLGAVDGPIAIDYDQATALAASGIDFADRADVTLLAPSMANLDFDLLGRINVDHISAGEASISDAQAAALIQAGVDFAVSDDVTVNAGGTHLSTSLKDLQALNVDTVRAAVGENAIHLDAGDLSQVSMVDLPQFGIGQDDDALDVTLNVDLGAVDDLERLAASLREAGVDYFAFAELETDLDADMLSRLEAISTDSGIGLVFGAGNAQGFSLLDADNGAYAHGRLYQEILTSFEASDEGAAADIEVTDGAASSLVESGMLRAYLSDHLVVDATGSGDRLLTTLKEVAEFGIDEIRTAEQKGGPVYIDMGVLSDASALDEIKTLFKNLDLNFDAPDKLFSTADKVALVVDAPVAEALGHVDGAFEQLAELGFTELDVLAAPDGFFLDTQAIEIKLIGEQDELYNYLHHGR